MADRWTPIGPHRMLWDTTTTTFKGCPVVASGTADKVTNPAVSNADVIIGVADEDAGPNAYGNAANEQLISVHLYGIVQMYAKGAITAGSPVKIGATITAKPYLSDTSGNLYAATQTLQTVSALTKATAGSQPYPQVGIAMNTVSADGDIVYVLLTPGAQY